MTSWDVPIIVGLGSLIGFVTLAIGLCVIDIAYYAAKRFYMLRWIRDMRRRSINLEGPYRSNGK